MTNFYKVKKATKEKAKDKKKTKKKADVAPIPAGPGVYAVNGINVQRGTGGELMPTWVQDNATYHINLRGGDRDDVYHVTRESNPRIQYFFKGTGTDIESVHPNAKERGKSTQRDPDTDEDVTTKKAFDALPDDVQAFIKNYWAAILG